MIDMLNELSVEKRVSTGIPGLNNLLEGGLIQNSTVLLRGKAGTGKTIFGLQYLIYGALHGEPGILLSIEENKRDLYRESARFGWNLELLEKEGYGSRKFRVISIEQRFEIKFRKGIYRSFHKAGPIKVDITPIDKLEESREIIEDDRSDD